jgi:hypothetical protein
MGRQPSEVGESSEFTNRINKKMRSPETRHGRKYRTGIKSIITDVSS